jgi:AcrR family transcriptional regulator
MPIDVDHEQRMKDIARATISVVKERGAEGVTVRAVAERLGGSTTLVTNFLPTRGDLLLNAVRFILDGWNDEMTRTLAGVPAAEYFAAYSRWNISTAGDDQAYRRLLIEVVASSGSYPVAQHAIRGFSRENHETLLEAARAADATTPEFAADVIHLVLRGFYLASLEDPERWAYERMAPIIDRLLVLVSE